MTLEEKLERFREAALNNAQEVSYDDYLEYQSAIDKEFEEHKKRKDKEIQDEIQAETENARRELNREILFKGMEFKKEISKKEKEIKKKLFEEVTKAVLKFKEKPDYIDFLCEKIIAAREFAAGDEMIVYIDATDEAYLPEIVKRTEITPQISTMDFMGGVRAVIRSKNILIDDSFKSFILERENEFVFKDFEA